MTLPSPSDEVRKKLKQQLVAGLVIPAESGVITSTIDIDEYKLSKEVGGFLHKMPIELHVRGGGAGQYEEWVTRYLTEAEACVLIAGLFRCLDALEEANQHLPTVDLRYC